MSSRPWVAPALLTALGLLLVWDRRLPYRQVDALHEGQFLSWANAAMHGRRTGLEIKTIYGYLQTETLAAVMQTCGTSGTVWRRYEFGVKALSVILFAWALWLANPSTGIAVVALLAGLAASPTWFDPVSMSFLRVVLPLTVLCWIGSEGRPTGQRLAVGGALCAATVWWSPELGVAGLVAMGIALLTCMGPRGATVFMVGATAVLLLPCWSTGARYPEFLAAHLAFAADRLTGYGWLVLPRDPSWWLDLAAGPLLAGFAWRERGRDPLLLALSLFAAASFLPALTRADSNHQELAHPAMLVALTRAAMPLHAPRFRRVIVATAVALVVLVKAVPIWDHHLFRITDRWSVAAREEEVRQGLRREPRVERLAGLLLPEAECRYYERLTGLLTCATRPGEPVFLMANDQILYFLADRLPATAYPLYFVRATAAQSSALLTELKAASPRYLLTATNAGPDGPDRERFPELYAWAAGSFAPIARLAPDSADTGRVFELREDLPHARLGTGRSRLAACGRL